MAGRVEGKVAFITGAARGQGRSHAVRLAEEGADIVAVDLCGQVSSVPYELGTSEDLAETVRQVEALDRRIVASQVDVRDFDALREAVDYGIGQLGRLDIVSANAGILSTKPTWEMTEQTWQDMIDINLTGVWHTTKAVIPHLIEAGHGGSIILTSSTAGQKGVRNIAHYVAAKHGVVGLMRSLSLDLAPYGIRINSIHPTNVNTELLLNDAMYRLFRPDLEQPTLEDSMDGFRSLNVLSEPSVVPAIPIPWVVPVDISNAVLFLASDEARYITGTELRVDAGHNAK